MNLCNTLVIWQTKKLISSRAVLISATLAVGWRFIELERFLFPAFYVRSGLLEIFELFCEGERHKSRV